MPTPREIWSAGDWPSLSQLIVDVGPATVRAAGIGPGMEVLDVGAGDGNVSIPAALAGAKVIALDPTPELFESGRARAAEAGAEIEWVEGHAMDLPYEDGRFDAVVSNFGAMFAPDHERAAAELARVGGRVVMTAWEAGHMNGRLFAVMAPFMPPPPAGAQPPFAWGDEEHARACFAAAGREITVEHDTAPTGSFASLDAYTDFVLRVLGPVALARPALQAAGRWDELRTTLREHFASYNETDDGSFRAAPRYLRISA